MSKKAKPVVVDADGVVDNNAMRKSWPLSKRLGWHFKRYWQLWLMALPAMAFVALFAYVPMYGIQLAFREFVPSQGLTGGEWVGFKYFEQFFTSPMFASTMITYMPHFISTVVIVAMLNIFLTPESGLLGRFLGEQNILDNADLIAPIYWISEVWQHCGWNAIIYLAALSSVDVSLYEAARIDGAGRLQLIRYVDIPAIMPTCVILLIMNMGSVLNVGFEKVWLMQNAMNMPGSEVISTYTFKIGIQSFQFSYGTAIGLFNTVINFVFLVVANAISKRVSDTSIF